MASELLEFEDDDDAGNSTIPLQTYVNEPQTPPPAINHQNLVGMKRTSPPTS
jgi:hypothetical protein